MLGVLGMGSLQLADQLQPQSPELRMLSGWITIIFPPNSRYYLIMAIAGLLVGIGVLPAGTTSGTWWTSCSCGSVHRVFLASQFCGVDVLAHH